MADTADALRQIPSALSFGSVGTSNLILVVGSWKEQMQLHVHWDVMTAASPFFARMRASGLREARENVVWFDDDSPEGWTNLIDRFNPPRDSFVSLDPVEITHSRIPSAKAWLTLLTFLYPPHERFHAVEAVLVLPLIKRLEMNCFLPQIEVILVEYPLSWISADRICESGLAEVVHGWFSGQFKENASTVVEAELFIKKCRTPEAIRAAADFLCQEYKRNRKLAISWLQAAKTLAAELGSRAPELFDLAGITCLLESSESVRAGSKEQVFYSVEMCSLRSELRQMKSSMSDLKSELIAKFGDKLGGILKRYGML